jgi:two-component system phosphate regulon sensor histidine kinase PhoR
VLGDILAALMAVATLAWVVIARQRGREAARLGQALQDQTAERKRSDQRANTLAERAALLDGMVQAMSEAVVAVDDELRVTFANPALRALTASTVDPVGRSLTEVLRSGSLSDLLSEATRSETPLERELDLPTPAGRTVLARAQRLPGGGALLVARDVTELRRLEKVRRDFVANVSHEFRTPVTALSGFAETLLNGAIDEPEQGRRFVEIIYRNARRLGRLVDELLLLTRAEAGRTPEAEPVEVSELIDDVSDVLQPIAGPRKVTIVKDVGPETPELFGARDALERVLLNLCENAVRHSPDGGTVTVSARPVDGGGRIELSVRDQGPGIEAQHLSRIFERFYRADPGRARESGGTGLGLSIVRHLVEAMHGEVGCESAPREGARFWARLPASSVPPA